MQNLNVLKRTLTQRAISFAVASSVADDSIDVTGCGGLAFQLIISASSGLSAATVTLQKSLDNSNWVNDGSAVSITGDGALPLIEAMQPLGGNFYRLSYALSAGLFTVNGDVLGKTFGGSSGSTTGGGGGGGSGTVTSVGLSVPAALLTVSGSPVTTAGTLAVTLPTRAANIIFSGPATGADATPTFRSLVAADIPNISTTKLTSGTLPVARGGTNSATALNSDRAIISTAGAIVEATTTATEIGYVNGVTSAIQTQLDAKEPAITTLTIAKGGTNSGTSLNNNRLMTSQSGAIKEASAITAARALISDANGIPTQSAVTSTELALLSGKSSVGDFSGPGSSTANAIVRFSGTGGKTGLDSAITIADTTGAMTWPGAAVHRSIYIPGGSLTNASDNFIEVTGTFNTAGANYGINTVMTTSGSSGSSQYFGQRSRLAAGYTGAGWVVGHIVQNLVAGTGTDTFGSGNVGYYGFVTGSTAGTNTSFAAVTSSGARNIGFATAMDTPPNSTSGRNIGFYAAIDPGNNVSQRNCCAFLTLTSSSSSTLAPPQTGALVVSNGTSTFDPIAIYDSSVKAFSVADGGDVTAHTGSVIISTAGKGLQVKEGSNARMGQSVLVGGTVTVSNTSVTASSRIFLTCAVVGGSQGFLSVGTITASTSFVINSSNVADISTINWLIVEPA